VRVDHLFAVRL